MVPLLILTVLFIVFHFLVFKNIEGYQWFNVLRISLPAILFLSIQFALDAQENIAKLRLEKEQLQTENYRAQLKALRSQIDPHFLFNSLNTLRSLVRQQHTNAEPFVMSLADFYRQTLKHNQDTTLPLSKELVVLQSYLFLMKSRNEDAMEVDINIDPEVHTLQIPTLALQLVLENCFKHNSMTTKKPLQIDISNTEDHYIQVRNNLQPKIGDHEPSGFGLDLLRKRYELLNISNGVIVQETADQFLVQVKLIA